MRIWNFQREVVVGICEVAAPPNTTRKRGMLTCSSTQSAEFSDVRIAQCQLCPAAQGQRG